MNFTNVDFRNKMEDKFFMNVMMLFIKRDIVAITSTYSIINDFEDLKNAEFLFHK